MRRQMIRQKYLEEKAKAKSNSRNFLLRQVAVGIHFIQTLFKLRNDDCLFVFQHQCGSGRTDEANKSQSHGFDIITRPKPHSNKLSRIATVDEM